MKTQIFVKKNLPIIFLCMFFFIGMFLRLYNIGWGSPYFFNPDERQNIAYPILDSHSPFMFDQKNFDTGTFPLIVIKQIFLFVSRIFPNIVPDPTARIILISRLCSVLLSLGISLLLYIFAKKMFGKRKAVLTYVLSLFSVGFIQFSHFGTIELWETFFFLLLFYFCWKLQAQITLKDSFLTGIILGLSLATKILTATLLPIIFCSFLVGLYHGWKTKTLLRSFLSLLFFVVISVAAFLSISPQIITNFSEFYGSIHFESTVALGTLPVFYTQEFYKTSPFIFQLVHIYPFLLNPLLMLFLPASVLYGLYLGIKKRNSAVILLSAFFLLLFIFESYVFVKWTRYVVPTLPFAYLLIGVFLDDIVLWTRSDKSIRYTIFLIPLVISIIFSYAFVVTVYGTPDTRITAAKWAKQHIAPSAAIVSEPYDLGLMPFNEYYRSITTVDFYTVDSDETTQSQLPNTLTNANYIILPSQRILKIRLVNPSHFPISARFYTSLENGTLGFQKVYETPCDTSCNLVYLSSPVFSYEETANVFDRPVVFIFKKIHLLSQNEYKQILKIR